MAEGTCVVSMETSELRGVNSLESTLAVPRGNLYPPSLRYLPAHTTHAASASMVAGRVACGCGVTSQLSISCLSDARARG